MGPGAETLMTPAPMPEYGRKRTREQDKRARRLVCRASAPRTGARLAALRGFHVEASQQPGHRALGRLVTFHLIEQFRNYQNPLRAKDWFPQSRGCREGKEIPVRECADPTQPLDARSGYSAPIANHISRPATGPQLPEPQTQEYHPTELRTRPYPTPANLQALGHPVKPPLLYALPELT